MEETLMEKKADSSIIRIGIDLGTTNSGIAINKGADIEIVPNILGDMYTPSVFGVDRAGNEVVGKKAYERLYKSASDDEKDNYKGEVKRLMGTSDKIHIERLNRDFSPEEVSAEILKSLKSDLQRKYPDLQAIAAVITVPAMFETMQNEATKRAGELAGFSYVILLQEPIAAAMAYDFDTENDETWLIYDFGGGTFDAAVISSKDGIQTVLGHGGDNFSGGKDIDSLIVEDVIKPKILADFRISNFDNEHFFTAFAKLKSIAETAKIELSSYEKITIEVDNLGIKDENGKEVYVSFTYTRDEFNSLVSPLVEKTIEGCEESIQSSGISSDKITKVIFVGGTTLIPYVRKRVEEALDIPVDFSVDPLTIVAKGAAVFGLGQRIPQYVIDKFREPASTDEIKLALNYDAMTAEEDELITGSVTLPSDDDYYIQISSDSGFYNSNKIKIEDGKFFDKVALEKGKNNLYWVYLVDGAGNNLPIYPDSFSITHGMTVSGAPISHGIGIVYAQSTFGGKNVMEEACDPYFDRTSIPPLSLTRSYKTARTLKKNENNALPIKVYEGDSLNPELNLILTRLEIHGEQLPYDLLEGTDLDITINVDESRGLSVEVYIPDIDLKLDARADTTYQLESVGTEDLRKDLDTLINRLREIENHVSEDEVSQIEQDIHQVRSNTENSSDTDAKQKAIRDIRNLKERLDSLEEGSKSSQLKGEYYEVLYSTKDAVSKVLDLMDKAEMEAQLGALEREGNTAIADEDNALLKSVLKQLRAVDSRAALENPGLWLAFLAHIEMNKHQLSDPQAGAQLLRKANEAISNNDFGGLRQSVAELMSLMPQEMQAEVSGDIAGIVKQ
jgi:molecular chaperone DnaK